MYNIKIEINFQFKTTKSTYVEMTSNQLIPLIHQLGQLKTPSSVFILILNCESNKVHDIFMQNPQMTFEGIPIRHEWLCQDSHYVTTSVFRRHVLLDGITSFVNQLKYDLKVDISFILSEVVL